MTLFHRVIRGKQTQADPPLVDSGSTIEIPLPPGQSIRFTVDITKLFEVKVGGIYILTGKRFLSQSDGWLSSNALTLTVTK